MALAPDPRPLLCHPEVRAALPTYHSPFPKCPLAGARTPPGPFLPSHLSGLSRLPRLTLPMCPSSLRRYKHPSEEELCALAGKQKPKGKRER